MDSASPLISVVMPFFQQEAFVLEAVLSVANQTAPSFEVLIVNDGDTKSDSLEVLEKISHQFSFVTVLSLPQNQGPSAARNAGIRAARGEYVLFLDADDRIDPSFLERTFSLLREKNLDFVTTDLQNFGANFRKRTANINFYDLLFNNRLHISALFRKEVLLLVGGFDESFREGLEDWDFWIRVLEKGFRGEVIHEPLFFYRRKNISRHERTQSLRPFLIQKIRTKHAHLFTRESLQKIKQDWKVGRDTPVFLHELFFRFGLRFPRTSALLLDCYFSVLNFFASLFKQ